MDFDAALIIRTGSAVLWFLLGSWMALRARGVQRAVGCAIGLWGVYVIANNLYDVGNRAPWASPYTRLWNAWFAGASAAAVVVAVVGWARRDGRQSVVPLAFSALAGVLIVVRGIFAGQTGPTTDGLLSLGVPDIIVYTTGAIAAAGNYFILILALYASLRVSFSYSDETRRLAPLVLLIGPFAGYALGSAVAYKVEPLAFDVLNVLLVFAVVLPMAGAWIVAAARGAGRSCSVIGLTLMACALLGLIIPPLAHIPIDQVSTDPTGIRGILRTIGWAIFVYAILQHDALALGLKPRAVKRGTLAAGALAVLFIVAQVAQNFFSAEYGLLTGGIVAGAFLFAASPLQRAMERLGTSNRSAKSGGTHDDAYKAALRVAMADKRLTRDEEVALADVAERLGIGARRAAEIRHDVESEKGVA